MLEKSFKPSQVTETVGKNTFDKCRGRGGKINFCTKAEQPKKPNP